MALHHPIEHPELEVSRNGLGTRLHHQVVALLGIVFPIEEQIRFRVAINDELPVVGHDHDLAHKLGDGIVSVTPAIEGRQERAAELAMLEFS